MDREAEGGGFAGDFVIHVIPYPDKWSEFEVHAQLYNALLAEGYDVRGCVRSNCSDGKHNPRVFFDLVVFDLSKNPIAIIECKNRANPNDRLLRGRQRRRYEKFGVALIVCSNMDDIPNVLADLKSV